MINAYSQLTEIDQLIGVEKPFNLTEKMWTLEYVGLYAQYAAVGLLGGAAGVSMNFCIYYYEGSPNVCASSSNIILIFWSFKIFFAVLSDLYHPFGLRRKPYIVVGWSGVLLCLLFLSSYAASITSLQWITINIFLQASIVLADVPSDGYLVELSQMERPESRGQVLATSQMIRYLFAILAGTIQMFLLNSGNNRTNPSQCSINWLDCWTWGLSISQYYTLLLIIVSLLYIPMLLMKEIKPHHHSLLTHPQKPNLSLFLSEFWQTFQCPAICSLIVFVMGMVSLSHFSNKAALYTQFYLIQITNFQSGLDLITSYGALVLGIFLFKRHFIHVNWRVTSLLSTLLTSVLGSLWILVYYNIWGLRNAWFTIFIDLDQSFANGLSQLLFSMAVIELAKPGQEATTYELLIGIGNAAKSVSTILSMQLLYAFSGSVCKFTTCPSFTVSVLSAESFEQSNGPYRFSVYTICLNSSARFLLLFCCLVLVSVMTTLYFIRFLPANKCQCHIWTTLSEQQSPNTRILLGIFGLFSSSIIIVYGIVTSLLLLNRNTSCWKWLGGSGC